MTRLTPIAFFMLAVAMAVPAGVARADTELVPSSPYAPLEYLAGSWKGQAVPKERSAQQFRGWTETHSWAWIFEKGQPAGMKLTIKDGKTIASATLTFDRKRNAFRLTAKPVKLQALNEQTFTGTLDSSGKQLTLIQDNSMDARSDLSTLRITIRPNSDFIRYTMAIDRADTRDELFSHIVEVGLTKEGESFAAGSTDSDRPKCIVTGAAAGMTVSYQGATYPICCTGCRDEFNENPEKYLKKAKMIAASATSKTATTSAAPAAASRFDDAFSSDVTTPPAAEKKSRAMPAAASSNPPETTVKTAEPKPAPAATAARAATLLRLGQNLEKNGNATAALKYYRQVAKDFPTTPAAKTAEARIKALEPK